MKIETDVPVLFLAGPIRNAPKWHEDAVAILLEINREIFIAAPVRHLRWDLIQLAEKDTGLYQQFERQRAWEQYYLYAAAQKGCIVFWLPKESECKDDIHKVYAHITMMELGQWIARCKTNRGINLVIGTDGHFPEWSTIEFEIKTEIPHVRIFSTLKETLDAALLLCGSD